MPCVITPGPQRVVRSPQGQHVAPAIRVATNGYSRHVRQVLHLNGPVRHAVHLCADLVAARSVAELVGEVVSPGPDAAALPNGSAVISAGRDRDYAGQPPHRYGLVSEVVVVSTARPVAELAVRVVAPCPL